MKIGFLYNHDSIHQIPHTVPVAASLARRGVAVHVLTSSAAQRETVAALWPAGVPVLFRDLALPFGSRIADQALRHVAPFKRIAILRSHAASFRAYDALVVPETTTTLLRTRFGVTDLPLIYIPHGAGDGAAGFQAVTRQFDLVLLSGEKVRDRMLNAGLVREGGYAVIGYPKFDLTLGRTAERFFDNDLPTVLYNPHFNPHISSWYPFGRAVLEWFARDPRYNLIFAPHVMLFQRLLHTSLIHRRMGWRGGLPRRLRNHPRIRIDTGSRRSIDMSYVHAADLYLGDASSQIYEWISRPRPAVFFNTDGPERAASPDFRHWALGQVIDGMAALPAALARGLAEPDACAGAQAAAFGETFSVTGTPAGERGAQAILDFLGRRRRV
ncbi:hypothetical protein [Acidisoma sp. 7E03]